MDTPQSAHLYKRVAIPDAFLNETDGNTWGGDIRIGDLTGDGRVDFLVYKSLGGMHPCFLGAFTLEGEPLWSFGDKHLERKDADAKDALLTTPLTRPTRSRCDSRHRCRWTGRGYLLLDR